MPTERQISIGRKVRLSSRRSRVAAARASETTEERKNRLASQRSRNAIKTANETPEERDSRLASVRSRAVAARENETTEEREVRLTKQRITTATSRIRSFQRDLKCLAFAYNSNINYQDLPPFQIGSMNVACRHCGALKWKGEPSGLCCANGKVKLPSLLPPPEPLKSLMTNETRRSRHFLDNIRKYNSCFQMPSFGVFKEVVGEGFMPTFKIQGQVHHRIGSRLPLSEAKPQFLQIYFMGGSTAEANQRCSSTEMNAYRR